MYAHETFYCHDNNIKILTPCDSMKYFDNANTTFHLLLSYISNNN